MRQKPPPSVFAEIFAKIEGGGTLNTILKTVLTLDAGDTEPTPTPRSTCIDWIRADEALSVSYARAVQERADSWAEQVHDVGTDVRLAPDHRRIAADTLKWVAAKAEPKKYGDKIELSGGLDIRDKRRTDAAVASALAADE